MASSLPIRIGHYEHDFRARPSSRRISHEVHEMLRTHGGDSFTGHAGKLRPDVDAGVALRDLRQYRGPIDPFSPYGSACSQNQAVGVTVDKPSHAPCSSGLALWCVPQPERRGSAVWTVAPSKDTPSSANVWEFPPRHSRELAGEAPLRVSSMMSDVFANLPGRVPQLQRQETR